jgi:hypothetical protein
VGDLGHQALDAGPDGVSALPCGGSLLGADGGNGLVGLAGPQGELPPGSRCRGALVPGGAGIASAHTAGWHTQVSNSASAINLMQVSSVRVLAL